MKTIYFIWRMYTLYLVMLRDAELWQNRFQQKLNQNLIQKQLFAWNKLWGRDTQCNIVLYNVVVSLAVGVGILCWCEIDNIQDCFLMRWRIHHACALVQYSNGVIICVKANGGNTLNNHSDSVKNDVLWAERKLFSS